MANILDGIPGGSILDGLDAAFGAANAKLTAALTKRQQQMQQQQ